MGNKMWLGLNLENLIVTLTSVEVKFYYIDYLRPKPYIQNGLLGCWESMNLGRFLYDITVLEELLWVIKYVFS
jgi:hypothetical protein